MEEQFARTELIMGKDGVERLKAASVIIFGVGGVGSYVAEGLARMGVGSITLVDNDTVDVSNINRQIPALHSTVGKFKADVMRERISDINPDCDSRAVRCFFTNEKADDFNFRQYDYVVDAIDTVTGKVAIIQKAYDEKVPVISSMGTGNKLDPMGFRIAPIEETKVCPLAKVVRKELKKRGIEGIKVLYSEEEQIKTRGGAVPGSVSFVPSVAGLIIAGEVAKDLAYERSSAL